MGRSPFAFTQGWRVSPTGFISTPARAVSPIQPLGAGPCLQLPAQPKRGAERKLRPQSPGGGVHRRLCCPACRWGGGGASPNRPASGARSPPLPLPRGPALSRGVGGGIPSLCLFAKESGEQTATQTWESGSQLGNHSNCPARSPGCWRRGALARFQTRPAEIFFSRDTI